jgi:hypothetical protein
MPRNGGGISSFSNLQEPSAAGIVVAATNVYWVRYDGMVRMRPIAGGGTTTIATGQNAALTLAQDATNLYWATNKVGGAIMSMPKSGGTPMALATNQASPFGIAVDAAYVYWANQGDGTVNKVPIAGGAVTPLATNRPDLASCANGTTACPNNCLKREAEGWMSMHVDGHPDTDVWMKFVNADGHPVAYNQGHVGHVIEQVNGKYTDTGVCPVCGGTTLVCK